jgi:hypothetical protein
MIRYMAVVLLRIKLDGPVRLATARPILADIESGTRESVSSTGQWLLAAIMYHASRFCPPGRRTHAVDPSVWIGLRQLAVQRIGD